MYFFQQALKDWKFEKIKCECLRKKSLEINVWQMLNQSLRLSSTYDLIFL